MTRYDIALCLSFAVGLILGAACAWIVLHARLAAWKRVARRNPVVHQHSPQDQTVPLRAITYDRHGEEIKVATFIGPRVDRIA